MKQTLTFFVNNNGTMEFTQNKPDDSVVIHTFHGANDFDKHENDVTISAVDMVQLINYYRYVKEHNIENDFINLDGGIKMEERILEAMRTAKDKENCRESVVFQNRLTGKLSFYNGVTNEFEFITDKVFTHLLKTNQIEMEKCICQGDNRYVLAKEIEE